MVDRTVYLSVKEMQELTGVSLETVRRWIRKRYIHDKWVVIEANQYYVHKDGFQEWRDEMKRLKTSPEGNLLARARFALR